MFMEEAAQSFQELGLSVYEAKALASLFSRHDSTAQDIAQNAEIPYTKIYAILNSLEKMGLVKTTLERPKKYRPLDPDLVVSTILGKQEQNLKELKKDARKHVKMLNDIYTNGSAYQGNGAVWFLPTEQAVWDTIYAFTNTMKNELRIVADEWIWRKGIFDKKLGGFAAKALQKRAGKQWNCIIPTSFSLDSSQLQNLLIEWIKFIADIKVNFRILDDKKIHNNAMIKDDTHLGFSFKKPTGEIYSGVIITDKSIVLGTLDHFNMLWHKALPVENKIREAAKKELKRRGING